MANEWNIGYPIDHTLVSAAPGEIRKLKDSVKDQLSHEHQAPVDGDETGTEHSNGSAVAFEGTSTPTTRPGGVALADNAIDRGRLWLDDNYDPPRPKRWKGSAFEDVGPIGLTISGATVFDGQLTDGSTWQDLDLSSIVGARSALVFLEILQSGGSGVDFKSKPKGYGGAYSAHPFTGASTCDFSASGQYGYAIVATDSAGVIQIAGGSTTPSLTIKLIAWIGAFKAS